MTNKVRYSRQIILQEVGELGQQKLQNAKVLVIGAGGLGCPVLQNLAAAGVGTIGIVDGDVVEESNLHRQTLFRLKDCGKDKAKVAAKVLLKLNPEIHVIVFSAFFTAQNANEMLQDYQIIVDCTDNIAIRYLINDMVLVKNIPVVYGSIHKFEGQVSVFNYQDGPSYRCLFPEQEGLDATPNCNVTGVLGILTNTIGTFQATEVLKMILGIGEVLSGKLLLYDGLNTQTQFIEFKKNSDAIQKGLSNGLAMVKANTKISSELTLDVFLEKCNKNQSLIIDIRASFEEPEFKGNSIVKVPLDALDDYLRTLDKNQEIILFCQSGKRSQLAVNYLTNQGFVSVFHLKNGIQSLAITSK